MSNQGLIIEERSRDIGDFLVGRLIPFRKKRMIGPFIFIDHMGPSVLGPNTYLDVDQHPHIGLSTLTYMLEGEVMHKDSMGTEQLIVPGTVNWMVAGKGVSHTERTPEHARNGQVTHIHGYQIWVALPKELEDIQPSFYHSDGNTLPKWTDGTARFKLIAGEGYGRKSPVPVYSSLFMIEIKNKEKYILDTKNHLKGEIGICIVDGIVNACGQRIEKGNILVSKVEDACKIMLESHTHVILFRGEAFPEERYMYWNFVSHDKEKLKKAKKAWKERTFPMMDDDSSYVPLPEL